MKFRHLLKIFVLSAAILTGCSSDDCHWEHYTNGDFSNLELPAIQQGTFPEGDVVLAPGEEFVCKPQVITPGDVYYQWYLNGEEVSSAKSYTLSADVPMRGKLRLELENDKGRVTLESNVVVRGGDYAGKYLIINEGWFGHEPGSVTAYDPATGRFEYRVIKNQNYGTELGVTSQSATMWKGKLYICSKEAPALTVVDPQTMYIEKQITGKVDGKQVYEFAGINERYGILTANGYIYRVDLETLQTERIDKGSMWQGTGSAVVFGDNLLLNVRGSNLYVIPVASLTGSDLSGVTYTTIGVKTSGGCRFVEGADGNLYTVESNSASGGNLVKIAPDLTVTKAAIRGDYCASSFGAYREDSFCGTADGNFFYTAGGNIYKCTFDDPAPSQPFTDYSKSGYGFYGAGIRVNPANGELVATYTSTDYSKNILARFDGATGRVIAEENCADHYWFPATIIFNN